MKFIIVAVGTLLLASGETLVRADSEIAVAIRYLQAEGVSHSQLYLYREDGKLLRQLTHEKIGQVSDPVFATNGATIVFEVMKGNTAQYWSAEPKGGHLHKMNAPPQWYLERKSSPYFTNQDSAPSVETPSPTSKKQDSTDEPEHYTTPDGRQKLILIHNEEDTEVEPEGMHFQIRDMKAATTMELGKLPGFSRVFDVLHIDGDDQSVFLIDPPLRLAFFLQHLNSTDGNTVYALDLANPRFVQLSENWAAPVPLPGEAAFLTLTETRYVPIPGSEKTANCSWLEHWDSNLKKVRYGNDSAAICYGASMYRPGKKPTTVIVPSTLLSW